LIKKNYQELRVPLTAQIISTNLQLIFHVHELLGEATGQRKY